MTIAQLIFTLFTVIIVGLLIYGIWSRSKVGDWEQVIFYALPAGLFASLWWVVILG